MIVLDKQKMQHLATNQAAPFAGFRKYRGLGFVDPVTAMAVFEGVASNSGGGGSSSFGATIQNIIVKIESLLGIGMGRREADEIVPIQNEIVRDVIAPAVAAMQDYRISYEEMAMLWANVKAAERSWLEFLHETNWSDGRAATQAEATLEPYFNDIYDSIRVRVMEITGGDMPSEFEDLIGGGLTIRRQRVGTSTFFKSAETYLPWILGGLALMYFSKIGKYSGRRG